MGSNAGRKIIYLVLVILSMVGLLLYMHGQQSSASAPPTPLPAATPLPGKVKSGPSRTPQQSYALGITPILDRSIGVFDALAARAARSSLDRMGAVCGSYANRINVLASHLDGVPHPYPWYSAVGRAHHAIIGTYHVMLGAIIECETASSNADPQGAAQAVADIASAARTLHRQDATQHALLAPRSRKHPR